MIIDEYTFRNVAEVLALVNPIYHGSANKALDCMKSDARQWYSEMVLNGRNSTVYATGGYALQLFKNKDGGSAFAMIDNCVAKEIVKSIRNLQSKVAELEDTIAIVAPDQP